MSSERLSPSTQEVDQICNLARSAVTLMPACNCLGDLGGVAVRDGVREDENARVWLARPERLDRERDVVVTVAGAAFTRALPLAPEPGEFAGCVDWLWMSLSRSGRAPDAEAVLARHAGAVTAENVYAQRIKLYRGLIDPAQVLTAADTGAIAVATLSYGVGNWYLLRGDSVHAREWFERSVQSGGWPAFGFIASEAELRRMR